MAEVESLVVYVTINHSMLSAVFALKLHFELVHIEFNPCIFFSRFRSFVYFNFVYTLLLVYATFFEDMFFVSLEMW